MSDVSDAIARLNATLKPRRGQKHQAGANERSAPGAGTTDVNGLSSSRAVSLKADADPLAQQLPLWPEQARGIPNTFARSAVFTVGRTNDPRDFFKVPKAVASVGGTTLSFAGEELRQTDQDVLMQLLHLSRNQSIEKPILFSAYSMLKELRWGVTSSDYERLQASISRMQHTSVRVSSTQNGETIGFQGALVRLFAWRDRGLESNDWSVRLEPSIVQLFNDDDYTLVTWRQRARLRSPLSKWLLSYLATHERPFPIKVETLHKLCGSKMSRMRDFKTLVQGSMESLVEIGFLRQFEIADGIVSVIRVPKSEMLKSPEIHSLEPVFKSVADKSAPVAA